MAQDTGALFVSLGLDVADLETGFIAAEKTIQENLARLNRENNVIRLQMDTDLAKLDGVGDELDKIKVKYEAINKQLDIQRQKALLLNAAYQDALKNKGEDNGVTKNAEKALLYQQKIIAQTEAELRKLETAFQQVSKAQTDLIAPNKKSLLDYYNELKGNVSGSLNSVATAFQGIKTASGSADGAITKSLEIIDKIPHPAGKAAAALAAIPLVMNGVENSLIELAKPAIAAGDSFYVMSRGMQMSIKDAAKLSMICKVTGIDIAEVNSALRRFSTQISKAGGDNAMLKMLERYGAEVRDSSGKIKNEIELAGELGKALKKAQAEGNGVAFRDMVGGKFWSGDFITFLEDFEDNVEQAKKVVKNGLADPVRAHALQGELNTLDAQLGQLNSAFSSAFMPIAEVLIPRTTERMGELTKVIADNAEGIKNFGTAAAEALSGLENAAVKVGSALIKTAGGIGEIFSKQQNSILDRYLNDSDVKSIEDLVQKELQQRYSYTERISIENNPALYEQTLAHFKPYFQALEAAREKSKAEIEKFQETLTGASLYRLNSPEVSDADLEALRKTFEETKKLSDEFYKLTHSDYDNKKLDIYNWREKLLQDESATAEQRELIEKITAEKSVQLEQEKEDKLEAIRKAANAEFKTELENRIEAIEDEKAEWISAGMEEAEALQLAERKKADAIKKINEEIADSLNSIYQTELEKRLAQIEKEKEAWIKKGADEVQATRAAEEAKAKARRDAAMDVIKQQAEEYKIYREQGYGGLAAYKRAKLKEAGVDLNYLNMTPAQLEDFQKAQQSAENNLMPNFATAEDKAEHQRRLKSWYDDQIKNQTVKQQNWVEYDGKREYLDDTAKNQVLFTKPHKDYTEVYGYDPAKLYKKEMENAGVTQEMNAQNEVLTANNQELDNFNKTVGDASKTITEMNEAAKNVSYAPDTDSTLPTAKQYEPMQINAPYAESYPTLPTAKQYEPYADLIPTDMFNDLTIQSQSLSSSFGNLIEVISNINLPQTPQTYSDAGSNQPSNITVNVHIDEATAWDSEHIQELTDKVADKISQEVIGALGGDSNTY